MENGVVVVCLLDPTVIHRPFALLQLELCRQPFVCKTSLLDLNNESWWSSRPISDVCDIWAAPHSLHLPKKVLVFCFNSVKNDDGIW